MKIVSFIPIKLNNQRLPGKNTMSLGGQPVCQYIFNTVSAVTGIDEKYVYCSDESIQAYMPDNIKFLKREKWLDSPETKGLQIIESFLNDVDADIYVLTHATSPFLRPETMQKALERVISGEYDSAFTAQEIKNYCWYQGNPVNYDLTNIVTTQNVEPVYVENGGFFIFTKEVFTKYHRRIGLNPYIAVTDNIESIDLDTREDFEMAQAAVVRLGNK